MRTVSGGKAVHCLEHGVPGFEDLHPTISAFHLSLGSFGIYGRKGMAVCIVLFCLIYGMRCDGNISSVNIS